MSEFRATEYQAERAIAVLRRAINAAENGNQAGENAVVMAAAFMRNDPQQLEDDLDERIGDSIDMDWNSRVGARAIMRNFVERF